MNTIYYNFVKGILMRFVCKLKYDFLTKAYSTFENNKHIQARRKYCNNSRGKRMF